MHDPKIFRITSGKKIVGDIEIPGDKSISHRAIILSSIHEGITTISNLLLADDVLNTIEAMRSLGVDIILDREKKEARVHGIGLHGLKPPKNPINCGNSGTLMRLLCGLLSAQKFNSVLIGDESLMQRPMLRVAEPLRLMGAKINLSENNTAPIEIVGSGEWGVGSEEKKLSAIDYEMPVASAQVKSAILLAGLYAEGETQIDEVVKTRDHTERMLKNPPGSLRSPTPFFKGGEIKIPGDISSAAFFIVLASITKNSDLIIRQVGINPFRTGIIDILKLMGAHIEIMNETFFGLEPVADLRIRYAPLHGITIPQDLISKAIDEFPIIFVAAVTAHKNTVLRGAKELRIKESDRIATMTKNFKILNIKTIEYDDGILIVGDQTFSGGQVDSFSDHRVAMSFAIAGNISRDVITVNDCACVNTSFPDFVMLAQQLGMQIKTQKHGIERNPLSQ